MDEFKEKIKDLLARATKGPWKCRRDNSVIDPSTIEIDGGSNSPHQWDSFAVVYVRTNGEPSEEGEANAELLGRARQIAEMFVNDIEHERRIQDLLDANNAYLERARAAEVSNAALRAQTAVLQATVSMIRDELLGMWNDAIKLRLAKERAESELKATQELLLQERSQRFSVERLAAVKPKKDEPIREKVIERLVNRFLAWRLPDSVQSDTCVTDRTYKFERNGTNLLSAFEAKEMIAHLFEDTPTLMIHEIVRAFYFEQQEEAMIERVARYLCPIDPDGTTEHRGWGTWYRPGVAHWLAHKAQARGVVRVVFYEDGR